MESKKTYVYKHVIVLPCTSIFLWSSLFCVYNEIQAQNDNFDRYWTSRAVTLIAYLNAF